MKMDQKTITTFVCPMHPEVTSKEPGVCSKCGMSLVKSKVNEDEQKAKE